MLKNKHQNESCFFTVTTTHFFILFRWSWAMSLFMKTFDVFLVSQATWPMNQSCIKKALSSRDEWVLWLQIKDILVKQQLWIVSLGLLLLAARVSLTYSRKLVKWRSGRPKNYNMFLIGKNSTKTWHRTWEIQLNLKNCVYDEFLLKTHHVAILKEGKRGKGQGVPNDTSTGLKISSIRSYGVMNPKLKFLV